MSDAAPWRLSADGLLVSVRATPKGGRDSIDGIETLASGQCVLKLRVRALPEDGEANGALRKLLAKTAGIPASSVAIVQGEAARLKTFRLAGDAPEIIARLQAAASAKPKRSVEAQRIQAKATLSSTFEPKRSVERATARPPIER